MQETQETPSFTPGLGRPLEEKMETHEYSCLENSMAGYSPRSHKELDTTEHTCTLKDSFLNYCKTSNCKELFKYIAGDWELPFAIEKIKQNTRIYSRKQTTWYRKDEEISWFHPDDIENIVKHIEYKINNYNHQEP